MDVALEHGCAIRDPLTGMWAASEDFFYEDVLAARRKLGRLTIYNRDDCAR